MSSLSRYGRSIETPFDLLGNRENDLTAALGFTLARSSRLVELLLEELGQPASHRVDLRIEVADAAGRTDLELDLLDEGHLVVVEAKRGWRLPTVAQLEQYAERVSLRRGGLLVTLSDCSAAYAKQMLPESIAGVPLRHLPWSRVKVLLSMAADDSTGAQRRWLGELQSYLERAVQVRDPSSGWAYCVVLAPTKPANGGERTFRDFVTEDNAYFHPFGWGHGWPTVPPNFLAFRWDGKVRQVRRVIAHEVAPNLQTRWPDIPEDDDTVRPHILYTLGPPIPMEPLPSGTNYRAARLWVLIDQLLTCDTLKEAVANSKALTGASPPEETESG